MLLFSCFVLLLTSAPTFAVPVNVELVLLQDISGSGLFLIFTIFAILHAFYVLGLSFCVYLENKVHTDYRFSGTNLKLAMRSFGKYL